MAGAGISALSKDDSEIATVMSEDDGFNSAARQEAANGTALFQERNHARADKRAAADSTARGPRAQFARRKGHNPGGGGKRGAKPGRPAGRGVRKGPRSYGQRDREIGRPGAGPPWLAAARKLCSFWPGCDFGDNLTEGSTQPGPPCFREIQDRRAFFDLSPSCHGWPWRKQKSRGAARVDPVNPGSSRNGAFRRGR